MVSLAPTYPPYAGRISILFPGAGQTPHPAAQPGLLPSSPRPAITRNHMVSFGVALVGWG